MSDPFQPIERRTKVTLAFLQAMVKRRYPVIISTKGELAIQPEYLDALRQNVHTIVQLSIVSTSDNLARTVEPNATPPSRLLRIMERLSASGIVVTCRLQPYHPSLVPDIAHYVKTCADAGVRQISLEHLKVPLEAVRNAFIQSSRKEYRDANARRDGREYVLPATQRVDAILQLRDACRSKNIYFGAADNEFQYLSDSWACCSGADLFGGFENYYRYQIGYAVRRGIGGLISLSDLQAEWRPSGSIDRYLNSRSRLGARRGLVGTIEDHIRYRWNTVGAIGSPSSYYGVSDAGLVDGFGDKLYKVSGMSDPS